MAQCYIGLNNFETAKNWAEKAITMSPEFKPFRSTLACIKLHLLKQLFQEMEIKIEFRPTNELLDNIDVAYKALIPEKSPKKYI